MPRTWSRARSSGCAAVTVVSRRRFHSRRCSAIRSATQPIARSWTRATRPRGCCACGGSHCSARRSRSSNRCWKRPRKPVAAAADWESAENGCSQESSYWSGPTGMTKTSIDAKCEARTLSVARVRTSHSKLALHHSPPAANQVDQEQDQRNHQQHVDDAAGHVERQAENPEQQQQDDERPEHGGY